jgi:hypothetical protein
MGKSATSNSQRHNLIDRLNGDFTGLAIAVPKRHTNFVQYVAKHASVGLMAKALARPMTWFAIQVQIAHSLALYR